MRARLITTKASPQVVDAAIQLTKDVLVPAAREQEGFRGYVAIYDSPSGTGMALTLWEDERTEEASDEALRPNRERFAEAFGAEVRVDKYDVAFAELTD